MSGHSKWHSIRHKKAAVDAKRGQQFTRLIREITVAARVGGGDADSNPRLRTAVSAAKAANMPSKNIENAILKGTGELPGVSYEEVTYEGYGPGGVAVLVETTTDNKNRTASEVRHLFSKHGGSLGEVGCVTWMFNKKGRIYVPADQADEDSLMESALEAGAEDVTLDGDFFTITTDPNDYGDVLDQLREKEYPIDSSEVTMIPENYVKVEGKTAESLMKLLSALEDLQDTQNVSANFDIDDELLEQLSA